MIRVLALYENGELQLIYDFVILLYTKLLPEKKLSMFLHILLSAEAIAMASFSVLQNLEIEGKGIHIHVKTIR